MDAKAVMNANMNAKMNAKSEMLVKSKSEMLVKSEYDIEEYQIMSIVKKLVQLVDVSIAAIPFARIEAQARKRKHTRTNHHTIS